MGKRSVLLIVTLLVIGGAWLSEKAGRVDSSPEVSSFLKAELRERPYGIERTIQYSFSVRNSSSRVFENVELVAHAPVMQTSEQRCCDRLDSSHPYSLESDRFGNQLMRFNIGELAPYASEIIHIHVDMRLAERAQPASEMDEPEYLDAEQYIEVGHQFVQQKAAQLQVENDPVANARAIQQWVAKNVKDTGYNRNAMGALYALQNLRGDSTESMHLFIALSRATGVPSRGIAGYVYDRNAVLSPREYHNWAEFYDGDAWRIADPHRKVFMKNENHYIAMQILTEDDPEGASGAQYWVNTEGLEVRMN